MTAASDVEVGHLLVAFIQPHRGHERAFHRWYERDHLYRAGKAAPGCINAAIWLAPGDLRALRVPAGENAISGPNDRGTHLATYFIQQGQLDEQQAWVAARMAEQRERGELFDARDHLYTQRYRVVGCTRRDADGVPPELALDRGYRGIAATWVARSGTQPLAALHDALLERALPDWMKGSPVELSFVLDLLAKPDDWPAAIPEPEGLGDRALVLHFFDADPRDLWQDCFVPFGDALHAHGAGELLLAAPFDANVPGRDPELQE